jgi:hypothetical protein
VEDYPPFYTYHNFSNNEAVKDIPQFLSTANFDDGFTEEHKCEDIPKKLFLL